MMLVTGGAGFIGSHFAKDCVVLDLLTYAGSRDYVDGSCELVVGDICDRELIDSIFKSYGIKTVVHFAAESHVDRSIADPEIFARTNVLGTSVLLDIALKYGARFHHVSTDEIHGSLEPGESPAPEKAIIKPSSPYAASKAGSNMLVEAYHKTYGLYTTITNSTNNFGARQHPEKIVPLIITRACKGLPIPIHGDGLQTRDWIYVEDHCDAIRTVIERGTPGQSYNVGSGSEYSILEMVSYIGEILDVDISVEFVKDRPGQDRRYALETSKIEALGWKPETSFMDGLRKTCDWYIDKT